MRYKLVIEGLLEAGLARALAKKLSTNLPPTMLIQVQDEKGEVVWEKGLKSVTEVTRLDEDGS